MFKSANFRPAMIALLLVIGLTQPVLAHPGHEGHGFADGWWHPITGLDHLLAMIAVGLLAVRVGGQALWAMPAVFLGSMFLGGLLALDGSALPAVEPTIAMSVLVLGLMVAAMPRIPWQMGAALIALFAAFHGWAHVAEMGDPSSFASYAVGFLLATAMLQAAAIAVGSLIASRVSPLPVRIAGGAIAALGVVVLISLI